MFFDIPLVRSGPKPCCFQPLMDFCAQQAETAICDDCGQRLVVRVSEGSCDLVCRHNLSEVRANSSRAARNASCSVMLRSLAPLCNPYAAKRVRYGFLVGVPEAGGRDADVISPFAVVDRDAAGARAVLHVPRGVARLNLALEVIDHSGGRPRIDVTYLSLGAVGVCSLVATPAEFIRYKHHLKNSRDQFGSSIVKTGPLQFANAGQERVYDAGSACLTDRGRPLRVFGPRGGSVRYVTVQAAALKSLVAHPEDLSGRPVRPGPALRLLDGYLRSLATLEEPPSSELASTIGVHLLDLVAATLGPTAEAANIVAERGVKAAKLQAILAEVTRRFSDPNFDLDNAAGALGMSRRYVQKLLEGTGKSFTEHLAGCRLERAFAMLTDPRHLHLAIVDIAFAVGFGDVSHFNRMFRRYFGETPSGVRAAATMRSRSDPATPHCAPGGAAETRSFVGFANTFLRHDR
jgi:AraC-like DNA-binding protein